MHKRTIAHAMLNEFHEALQNHHTHTHRWSMSSENQIAAYQIEQSHKKYLEVNIYVRVSSHHIKPFPSISCECPIDI